MIRQTDFLRYTNFPGGIHAAISVKQYFPSNSTAIVLPRSTQPESYLVLFSEDVKTSVLISNHDKLSCPRSCHSERNIFDSMEG